MRLTSLLVLAATQLLAQTVATVLSQPITLADLEPPSALKERYRATYTPQQFDAWIAQSRKDALASRIWNAVKQDFCAQRTCTPTEAELLEFENANATMRTDQSTRDRGRVREIEASLRMAPHESAERAKLEKELESVKRSVSIGEEIERAETVRPGPNLKIAEMWVGNWKFFRELHRAYGGRVIFQQAGPEPLEAMKQLLVEHEQRGTFRFFDEGMRKQFWAYYVSMGHNPMPDGASFLETPWWRRPRPAR